MANLATVADLQDRLGRALDATETTRAGALLEGASARVRTYTGQQFEQSTTTNRLRVRNGSIRLSQRPVTAVTTVKDTDGNVLTHTWHAGDRLDVADQLTGVWLDVTYTHGYATIPDDIVEVVCQMVLRTFGLPSESAGITQQAAGSFSYSVSAAAAAGAVGMLADERAALAPYRRVGGTIRTAH